MMSLHSLIAASSTPQDVPLGRAASGADALPKWFGSAVTFGLIGKVIEVLLVAGLFALLAGGPVPAVNEAHYWTKAKSFWDPSFAARDHFLQSADAHWSFYLSLGQATRWLSLEYATWLGRGIVWVAMAAGWVGLSRVFRPAWGIALLGAGLLVVLSRWGHLSGEWIVGGAEAKGLAFACLFASLAAAVRDRWALALVLGGLAAGFHVLVGGWLVVCLLGALAIERTWPRPIVSPTWSGRDWLWVAAALLLGGLLSLPGLLPALALAWGQDPEIVQRSHQIYVLERLPHHLVLWAFHPFHLLAFCALCLMWLALAGRRWTPPQGPGQSRAVRVLNQLTGVALLLSAIGAVLSVLVLQDKDSGGTSVGLLRFYWFRCADVLLPVSVTLLWPWPGRRISASLSDSDRGPSHPRPGSRLTIWPGGWQFLAARLGWSLLAAGLILVEATHYWGGFIQDPRPAADKASLPNDPSDRRTQEIYRNWIKVCTWIRTETPADALFLTPRHQQTFKWYAQRAEVVSWKDVPQDSRGLIEWRARVQDCFPVISDDWSFALADPTAVHLRVQRYEVDYLLMTQNAYQLRQRFGQPLPYRLVYPQHPEQKTTYVVLAID